MHTSSKDPIFKCKNCGELIFAAIHEGDSHFVITNWFHQKTISKQCKAYGSLMTFAIPIEERIGFYYGDTYSPMYSTPK